MTRERSQFVTMFADSLRDRGVLGTGALLWRNAQRARSLLRAEAADPFDSEWGTDTREWVLRGALGVQTTQLRDVSEYIPTPRRTIERVFDALSGDPRDYTFVDYGSGKGRVLMLAAERAFRRVVGVEISAALQEIAAANCAKFLSLHPEATLVELVCSDAVEYEPPHGKAVYYFHQPFPDWVMTRVLERIIERLEPTPSDIVVAHISPFGPGVVERTGRFKRLASDENRHNGGPWTILSGIPKLACP